MKNEYSANVKFANFDETIKCTLSIQENLTIDLNMPLNPSTFKMCAEFGLYISIYCDGDNNEFMIDTQVVPEAIEDIEFLID